MTQDVFRAALAVAPIVAVSTAALSGAVVHGVLRPQLEGRGVTPWRLRDTLTSIPLVLLGSAGVGGSVAVAALVFSGMVLTNAARVSMFSAGFAGLIVSAFVLLLGVIALRKLAP